MTYPAATAPGTTWRRLGINLISFCSCQMMRTKLEQKSRKRETAIMWLKDVVAGTGLIIFMVSSFVLASGAHAVLAHF
jgi:hypothetical protein